MRSAIAPAVAVAILAIACSLVCGCPLDQGGAACTEIGCGDAFVCAITQSAGQATEGGVYEISYLVPGEGEEIVTCDTSNARYQGCESTSGDVGGSGNELGQIVFHVYPAWGEAPPDELTLEVRSGGALLGEETFSPDWNEFYPNGEECDEYPCYQADEEAMIVGSPPGA